MQTVLIFPTSPTFVPRQPSAPPEGPLGQVQSHRYHFSEGDKDAFKTCAGGFLDDHTRRGNGSKSSGETPPMDQGRLTVGMHLWELSTNLEGTEGCGEGGGSGCMIGGDLQG